VGKADAHPPHVQRRSKKRTRHGLPANNNGSYREYASGSHAATNMLALLAELGHTGLRRTRVPQPNSIWHLHQFRVISGFSCPSTSAWVAGTTVPDSIGRLSSVGEEPASTRQDITAEGRSCTPPEVRGAARVVLHHSLQALVESYHKATLAK